MNKLVLLFTLTLIFCASLVQAKHKPTPPIKADLLCCGCTAYINGSCVGYHCGLCPLFSPRAANRISLLPVELAPFLPELASPQSQCEAEKEQQLKKK